VGRPPQFGGFSDVDATGDAPDYADYLDAVRGLDAVAEWKERSFALLEPRPGAVLLDVGCGAGNDVRALAARVAPGGRAIGVDASEAMIEEARRRGGGPAVEFRVADVANLGLADASVDAARCERVLQHVDRPEDAVAEMARVVRTGGRVVAAEPDWGTLVVDPGDADTGREVARAAAERVRSGTVGRRLRGMLIDAGLVEVDVTARVLVVTGAASAAMLFDIGGALEHALASGRVTAAAADAWREEAARAESAGRHLAAMTAFMAWGRVTG
jgi:SAM-dependent methyltransferase